jgi:hypothetical protein
MGIRTESAMRETVGRCAEEALKQLPRLYVAAPYPYRDPANRAESQRLLDEMAAASDARERAAWEARLARWAD